MNPDQNQLPPDDLSGDAPLHSKADACGTPVVPADELATAELSADVLSWVALQYVLSELSPMEEAAWEQRLLVDSNACTAVAEATTLVQGLDFVLTEHAPITSQTAISATTFNTPARTRSSRGSGRKFLAMSALSLVGVAALATTWVFWSPADQSARDTEVAARLVGIWRSHSSSTRPLGNLPSEPLDAYVWSDDSDEVELPGWLLAAVSLDSHSSPDSADWEEN